MKSSLTERLDPRDWVGTSAEKKARQSRMKKMLVLDLHSLLEVAELAF